MENANHNPKEYTLDQAANLVGRSKETIRLYCNDKHPIDHKKFGTTYVITELGVKQARERARNARPGPKGPRKKTSRRKVA